MSCSIIAKPVTRLRNGHAPWIQRIAFLFVTAFLGAQAAYAQGTNRLESIDTSVLSGNNVQITLRLSDEAPTPLTFTVDNPARIALDLPNTAVAMSSRRVDVKQGVVDTVNVAEANGRTRVVLNVDSLAPYETEVRGNTIVVTVGSGARVAAAGGESVATAAAAPAARAPSGAGANTVRNIDFRRGSDGSGRVIVELSNPRVPADLRQEGGRIVVNFAKTGLPEALMQRLDVTD